jgi:hypothetical protein
MAETIYDGQTFTSLRKLALHYGVNFSTFKGRRERGWSLDECLGLKVKEIFRADHRPITVAEKDYSSISQAAKAYGLPANLCRDRVDAGWPIDEIFGITPIHNRVLKKSITIDGIKYPSLRQAAAAVKEPFTTFLKNTKDNVYVKPSERGTLFPLNGTTKPFIYGRHIYPSLNVMLMSCDNYNESQSTTKSRCFSAYRTLHHELNLDVGEIAYLTGINKVKFLNDFDYYIHHLYAKLDNATIKDCIVDATDHLETALNNAGFCRKRYLAHYGIKINYSTDNPRLTDHLFAQSAWCDSELLPSSSSDAAKFLGISDSCLRQKRVRMGKPNVPAKIKNSMLMMQKIKQI